MRYPIIAITLFIFSGYLKSQEMDTFYLRYPVSKYDTIIYKRIIEFNKDDNLYHVRDYFENGQLQMEGMYSSFDKHVKENYGCNYKRNMKQGLYQAWYKNGNREFRGNFVDGRFHGPTEEWYSNGQISTRYHWVQGDIKGNGKGQMHGACKGWAEDGKLLMDAFFDKGLKVNPIDTNYHYLLYKPKEYNTDTVKRWPLIIYLHGGSNRGTDLHKLYSYGIPDQMYRGRAFPFIIAAPQCPIHHRWSTDNWFENFYNEITSTYRIDTNRVYLTGVSLGGSGTWYLAIKYPEKFAAIAPMSGFTSHIEYIDKNIDKLIDIPVWAFHGKIDKVVQFEETERIIRRLEGKNKEVRFRSDPDVGHWMHWLVYPEQELYDWFLLHDKRLKNNN